jgi:hypothetical protein
MRGSYIMQGTVILTSLIIDAGKCPLRGGVIRLYIAGKCHAGISPLTKVSRGEVPPHRFYAERHYAENHYVEHHNAEHHYAEHYYVEHHCAECRYVEYHNAKCCYAEHHYAEHRYAEHYYVEHHCAECHYAEYLNANCHYAERCYAEYRVLFNVTQNVVMQSVVAPLHLYTTRSNKLRL